MDWLWDKVSDVHAGLAGAVNETVGTLADSVGLDGVANTLSEWEASAERDKNASDLYRGEITQEEYAKAQQETEQELADELEKGHVGQMVADVKDDLIDTALEKVGLGGEDENALGGGKSGFSFANILDNIKDIPVIGAIVGLVIAIVEFAREALGGESTEVAAADNKAVNDAVEKVEPEVEQEVALENVITKDVSTVDISGVDIPDILKGAADNDASYIPPAPDIIERNHELS